MKKNLNILFPPLLFLLIGLFLLIIVQFSVWRIIFALTVSGWDSSWPVLLFVRSLFQGLRLDGVVTAYFFIPLFFLIPFYRISAASAAIRIYIMILTAGISGGLIGDIYFYQEFASHYNIFAYSYENGSSMEVLFFILGNYPLWLLIPAVILFVWGADKLFVCLMNSLRRNEFHIFHLPAYVIFGLVFLVSAARGGWQQRPIDWGHAMFSSNETANQIALNPLFFFARSVIELNSEQNIRENINYFTPDSAVAIRRTVFGESSPIPGSEPWSAFIDGDEKPHVVLVVLESFAGDFVGHINRDNRNVTPVLDSLAAAGLYAGQCYANGKRSAFGLSSILTGIPVLPGLPVISRTNAVSSFPTIASTLKGIGYGTSFIYGGDADFDNMKGFAIANGFDRVLDRRDLPDYPGTIWGIYDHFVFRETSEYLARSNNIPQFITLFTTTNHPPFEIPDEYINGEIPAFTGSDYHRRIKKTMHYTDLAIRGFVKDLESTGNRKIILILCADHGLSLYNDYQDDLKNARIPLVFNVIGANMPAVVNSYCSQTDLYPTLLDILDVKRSDQNGRSLLMGGSGFVFRLVNTHFWWLEDGFVYEEAFGQFSRTYSGTPIDGMPLLPKGSAESVRNRGRAYLQNAYLTYRSEQNILY